MATVDRAGPLQDVHLSGVFEPIVAEVDVADLRVEGELPVDIDGDYVRNGPNPRFAPIGDFIYPIDGDGMLHRVQLGGGKARYTNRFVRTPALMAEEKAGRALWGGISNWDMLPGEDLVGPSLAGTFKDLPGINVVRHGGRLLALGESCSPFLMSPDLATLGRETFDGNLPIGITAHPKIDPRTGEMVAFCYNVDSPYLTWSVIGKDGATVRAATPVDGVDQPSMIHDMALTDAFVVLVVGPLYFDLMAAMSGGSLMSWQPEHGTRIALIGRQDGIVTWFSTDAFWMWHTANATEETLASGGVEVLLDYVRWDAPGGLVPGTQNQGSLARVRLNPRTGAVVHETLVDRNMEFPRVDDRALTTKHGVVGTSLKTGPHALPTGDADSLGWYDTRTDSFDVWFGGSLAVGEQTYVPAPGDPDPTHGWWVAHATNREDMTSKLLILSATDPKAGPVAIVHLPQRVPLGLHGAWLPSEE